MASRPSRLQELAVHGHSRSPEFLDPPKLACRDARNESSTLAHRRIPSPGLVSAAWYNFSFDIAPGGRSVPLYEYQCTKCGRQTERIEKVAGPHLKKCPHCGGKV